MSAVAVERATDFATDLVVKQLEPTIGAEISGVNLGEPLTVQQRDQIKTLLLKHRVLFFRNQPISGEQQLALARQFGKIYEHPTTRRIDHRVKADSAQSHRISATIARQERHLAHRYKLAGAPGLGRDTARRRPPAVGRRHDLGEWP